jgi:hypothetical protein
MHIRQPARIQGSAALGTAVWLLLLAVPGRSEVGLGSIERLFLLAPLVLGPKVLELAGSTDFSPRYRAARAFQPGAAILVAVSFMRPQEAAAAMLATPWLVVTVLAGLGGLDRLVPNNPCDRVEACYCAGLLMLPVGGIGLVQSRFGATPLGFHEPWVLLVAVHFHYVALLAPVLVGVCGSRIKNRMCFNHETDISFYKHILQELFRTDCSILEHLWDRMRSFDETPVSRFDTIRLKAYRSAAAAIIVGSPLMATGFLLHLPGCERSPHSF